MPTVKNGFHILNLHPKKMYLKNTLFFNANLLEKFHNWAQKGPNLCYTVTPENVLATPRKCTSHARKCTSHARKCTRTLYIVLGKHSFLPIKDTWN